MSLALNTRIFGKKIYRYPRVESTNKIARLLAEKGAEEGTVVVAGEQTQGEGRGNHRWFSPQGGLWLSLILRLKIDPARVPQLNILGAVGIARSIEKIVPLLSPQIQWPNDAMIKGKKVGGVLSKAALNGNKVDFVIMGIGINLNIEEFPFPLCFTATSLKKEIGHTILEEVFLENLLKELEDLYLSFKEDFSTILEKARLLSSLLGKQVRIQTKEGELIGQAQNLDEEGGLILRLESGLQKRISPEEGYLRF